MDYGHLGSDIFDQVRALLNEVYWIFACPVELVVKMKSELSFQQCK